jgi:hypothetical protein
MTPLTSLYGCNLVGSRSDRLTSGRVIPRTHWIGDSLDLRSGLDMAAKRRICTLAGNGSSSAQFLASKITV